MLRGQRVRPKMFSPASLKTSTKLWKPTLKSGAVGLVTLPIFASGVADISEGKNTSGYSKILGSSIAFSGLRGAMTSKTRQGIYDAAKVKIPYPLNVKHVNRLAKAGKAGAIAGGILGAAVALGQGHMLGRQRNTLDRPGKVKMGLTGLIAGGAAMTSGKKMAERAIYLKALDKALSPRHIPEIAGAGAGGLIGGALGILVSRKVVDHMLKNRTQKS